MYWRAAHLGSPLRLYCLNPGALLRIALVRVQRLPPELLRHDLLGARCHLRLLCFSRASISTSMRLYVASTRISAHLPSAVLLCVLNVAPENAETGPVLKGI